MQRILVTLFLAFSCTSCLIARTTANAPIAPDGLSELHPGASTAADVVATLGAPNEVVQLAKRSAYRYDYTQGKRAMLWLLVVVMMNDDVDGDRVWVFFDENDVLTHVASTFESGEARYAMPWSGD